MTIAEVEELVEPVDAADDHLDLLGRNVPGGQGGPGGLVDLVVQAGGEFELPVRNGPGLQRLGGPRVRRAGVSGGLAELVPVGLAQQPEPDRGERVLCGDQVLKQTRKGRGVRVQAGPDPYRSTVLLTPATSDASGCSIVSASPEVIPGHYG